MNRASLGIGDLTVPVPGHIGLFHYGTDELRRWQVPLLRPALDHPNESILLFGPTGAPEAMFDYLQQDLRRDLSNERSGGRILLATGDVDVGEQLDKIVRSVEELVARGAELVRALFAVGWGVEGFPAPEDVLWCESRFAPAVAVLPVIGICAYDAAAMPGQALVYGGLENHPLTLVDGTLAENPSFIPSQRYFSERLITLPWLRPA